MMFCKAIMPREAVPKSIAPSVFPPAPATSTIMERVFPSPEVSSLPPPGDAGAAMTTESGTSVRTLSLAGVPFKLPKYHRTTSPSISAYALMEGDVVRWYFGNLNGTPASESVRTEVPLSVVIAAPASPGGGSEDTSGDGNTLSMIVDVAGAGGKTDGAIDFGTASRGSIALQNIMLKNGGSIAATVSASVSGNAVFRRYLHLDEKPWREYQTTLPGSANSAAALSLPIPADYAESGAKSGSLIFWATPTAQ